MARILIIDDSSFMRGKIKSIIKNEHHEIIETDNGLKGLQLATLENPDCVILDIIMPGMDGLKILKSLQERGTMIPLIVVTADIQDSTRKQCWDLGAFAVLNKPPKKEELLRTIRDALTVMGEQD